MGFKNLPSKHESWLRFCRHNQPLIDQLSAMKIAFDREERFDELLRTGTTNNKDSKVELASLSEEDWRSFDEFVASFRRYWQTYFVETLYSVYFREVKRRSAEKPA